MKLKVLSLFDGMGSGRIALGRAGIKIEKYYASEVNKYAMAVARYNYPDTVFVGDIRNLNPFDFEDIDLLIGGSPCQNFSFAGKRQGMVTSEKIEITKLEQYLELKEQGFKFEGQSYLFWEYVRLLGEIKPKWFLLENVKMAKRWERVITFALGVEPIEINSALVSAQNRRRLYWTNIPVVGLPKDKRIFLEDVIISGWVDRDKSYCIDANYYKGGDLKSYFQRHRRQLVFEMEEKGLRARKLTPVECERLQTLPDNYTGYGLFENGEIKKISNTQRYKMIGNGWTVDVIAWIFSFIGKEKNHDLHNRHVRQMIFDFFKGRMID